MPDTMKSFTDPEAVKARLRQLWDGAVPLKQTFWLYYFCVVFVLKLLGAAGGALGFIFGLIAIVWAGFMVRPIWTAAEKYEGKPLYALLAKIAVVLILLGILGSLSVR